MELISIPYPPLATLSSSRKHSFTGQPLILPNIKRYPDAGKLKFTDFKAQTSESLQGRRKSNLTTAAAIKQEIDSKDDNLVFVAGATGKVGSRTVRELLKLGFQVRAGVRSAQKAKSLVQSVQQMKLDDGSAAVEKLKIVECDLERDRIEPAIGNASVVICCIGASEKEIFDITGPYRIDYKATKTLIDAATVAEVNHFILLTSLGTNKVGFPAAILNLFWGVLIWKRKAEEALIASGVPYTIVRPGGMERPTDAYKETHNIFLAKEDTLFGGQVSNLQVAELMAFMAKNRSLSYCKVVEVIAETTAPLTPMGELLTKIPSQRVDSSLPKEPQSASTPDPAPSQTAGNIIDKEPTQTRVQITEHLSPYIAYADLKPPSSPTPTPSTSQGSTKGHVNVVKAVSEPVNAVTQIGVSEPKTGVMEAKSVQVEVLKTRPLSPYVVYEDLKPPTSPSPNAQTVSLLSTSPVSDASKAQPSTSDKPVEKQQHSALKPEPLSPFTMYEDLKPPTSPIPSPRKC